MKRSTCFLVLFLLPFPFLLFPLSVWAWGNCPFGKVNDPYPGLCARYLDTKNDQICDYSQASPASSFLSTNQLTVNSSSNFTVWPLILVTGGVYLAHWYLTTKTSLGEKYWWLGKQPRQYFWNGILLLSFIPTAVTALLLGSGVVNRLLTDWHFWLGTVFAMVGFLHCWERLSYFLSLPKPR